MSFQGTMICDSCGENHMLEPHMDIPPNWFGIRMVLADEEGSIMSFDEENDFFHFCSQKCLVEFVQSEELTEKAIYGNHDPDDEDTMPPNEVDNE